jgi:hypothetical protein
MIQPMVLGIDSLINLLIISIQSPFPELLKENQVSSYGSMYWTQRTRRRAEMMKNSTILLSSQGTLIVGDLGYSSW